MIMSKRGQDELNKEFIRELFRQDAFVKIEYNDSCGRVIPFDASVCSYDNYLELVPEDNGHLDYLQIGSNLILVVVCENEKSVYYFVTKILGIKPGPPLTLKLFQPFRTNISALRCFFRCNITIPFQYIVEGVLEFDGTTKNLSAGGLLGTIKFDSTLEVGSTIDIRFSIPDHPNPMQLPAQIVRMETSYNQKKQDIAVKFIEINESQQNQIIKYLFQYQRELKAKRASI
jgi:hypothetical protein